MTITVHENVVREGKAVALESATKRAYQRLFDELSAYFISNKITASNVNITWQMKASFDTHEVWEGLAVITP